VLDVRIAEIQYKEQIALALESKTFGDAFIEELNTYTAKKDGLIAASGI
jgi:hypothetical protein